MKKRGVRAPRSGKKDEWFICFQFDVAVLQGSAQVGGAFVNVSETNHSRQTTNKTAGEGSRLVSASCGFFSFLSLENSGGLRRRLGRRRGLL